MVFDILQNLIDLFVTEALPFLVVVASVKVVVSNFLIPFLYHLTKSKKWV